MCRPAICPTCGKTTWQGCGRHIEQVKAQVPADQWCPGHQKEQKTQRNPSRGFFSRLFS